MNQAMGKFELPVEGILFQNKEKIRTRKTTDPAVGVEACRRRQMHHADLSMQKHWIKRAMGQKYVSTRSLSSLEVYQNSRGCPRGRPGHVKILGWSSCHMSAKYSAGSWGRLWRFSHRQRLVLGKGQIDFSSYCKQSP